MIWEAIVLARVEHTPPNPSEVRTVLIKATQKFIKKIDRWHFDDIMRKQIEADRESVNEYFGRPL